MCGFIINSPNRRIVFAGLFSNYSISIFTYTCTQVYIFNVFPISLVCIIRTLRICLLRILYRALQFHIQHQIIISLNLAVGQPLLGYRDAVLAGDIGIHQICFCDSRSLCILIVCGIYNSSIRILRKRSYIRDASNISIGCTSCFIRNSDF